MKKVVAVVTVLSLFIFSTNLYPYDLGRGVGSKKNSGPITVALVPFAEHLSPAVEQLIRRLNGELKKTRGLRILDRSKTDAILQYYLSHVERTSEDDAVSRSITAARQALIAGSYPAAGKLLDDAEKKIRAKAARGGSNEGLYQVHLLRAKILHADGNHTGVGREYEQVALLAPLLELDPNLYSNWERSALKAAREKIRGEGRIEVASRPQGSEVFLNGLYVGISPLTLKDLPPADHLIEVKTVGHAPAIRRVSLKAEETCRIKVDLIRIEPAVPTPTERTVRPSLYRSELELSRLISTLGYHMGVDKIVLVADKRLEGRDTAVFRVIDARLGAVQKENQVSLDTISPGAGIALLTEQLGREARTDVLSNPGKYANRSVGSVELHERRRPFYKKPLFWVLVGTAAGTGGALGAILGGGAAAVGGVVIGF